jgi:Protein of unknown function (DUF2934)
MVSHLSTPILGTDKFSPNTNTITFLAYKLWEERGRPIGSPEEDWFNAICQIKHDRTPGSVL